VSAVAPAREALGLYSTVVRSERAVHGRPKAHGAQLCRTRSRTGRSQGQPRASRLSLARPRSTQRYEFTQNLLALAPQCVHGESSDGYIYRHALRNAFGLRHVTRAPSADNGPCPCAVRE